MSLGQKGILPASARDTGRDRVNGASLAWSNAPILLIDDDLWPDPHIAGRRIFRMAECDGQYQGLPEDDAVAIERLEHNLENGMRFLVILWPSFWWLEHYQTFARFVEQNAHRVASDNDDLAIAGVERGLNEFGQVLAQGRFPAREVDDLAPLFPILDETRLHLVGRQPTDRRRVAELHTEQAPLVAVLE